MGDKEKLVKVLQSVPASIGYVPMGDEPDYRGFLDEHGIAQPSAFVPASKDLVPSELAKRFKAGYPEGAALFIPGRRFDKNGTRHGRGAGWYDRFLSEVPSGWVRVGVAAPELMHEKLERKSWDQPVHFVLVKTPDGYEVWDAGERR